MHARRGGETGIIVNGENIITEYELSNANCQICIVTVMAFYADLHRTQFSTSHPRYISTVAR